MRSCAGSGWIPSGVLSMKDFNYVAGLNDRVTAVRERLLATFDNLLKQVSCSIVCTALEFDNAVLYFLYNVYRILSVGWYVEFAIYVLKGFII